MQNKPIEVTLKVTDVFEELGIPYVIGGSLASTLHGMVRSTQDSDIIADMRSEHIRPFVDALQAEFFIDQEMFGESIHRDTMFKVDVFIPRPRPRSDTELKPAEI